MDVTTTTKEQITEDVAADMMRTPIETLPSVGLIACKVAEHMEHGGGTDTAGDDAGRVRETWRIRPYHRARAGSGGDMSGHRSRSAMPAYWRPTAKRCRADVR
jgi:hypothetical protein